MSTRIPPFLNKPVKHKVCIICEGYEEYEYLMKLKDLDVWSSIYDVILFNAEGNGNIPAIYQDKYQNGSYEIVVVFCDTDGNPYEQYETIKDKINKFHGDNDIAAKVIFFGNPCTMQIIVLHWGEIILTSHKKSVNAKIIEKHTGIKRYEAKEDQRHKLFDTITVKNYETMRERLKKLPSTDNKCGSSNLDGLLSKLESDDVNWIDLLNDELES